MRQKNHCVPIQVGRGDEKEKLEKMEAHLDNGQIVRSCNILAGGKGCSHSFYSSVSITGKTIRIMNTATIR